MSGGALAEMESEEDPSQLHNLNESGFPVTLKRGGGKVVEVQDWGELLELIDSRPKGVTELAFIKCFKCAESGKALSFTGFMAPEIAPYFDYYRKATATWIKGDILPGDYRSQPAILSQACETIQAEINNLERRQMQMIRRQQREAQDKAHG